MNVKMDKKKTTYYYDESTEALIEKGKQAFLKKNWQVTTIKLYGFIDMCIKEAVETLPQAINKLTQDKNNLIKKNLQLQKEIESVTMLLKQIQRNNSEKKFLKKRFRTI